MDRQGDRPAADGAIFNECLFGLRRVDLERERFTAVRTNDVCLVNQFHNSACAPSGLAGLDVFFSNGAHWRVAIDLVLIGLFGGFFIVPLYALIQERSPPSHRSRIIAAISGDVSVTGDIAARD